MILITDLDLANDDANVSDDAALVIAFAEFPDVIATLTTPRTDRAWATFTLAAPTAHDLFPALVAYCGGDSDQASDLASDAS